MRTGISQGLKLEWTCSTTRNLIAELRFCSITYLSANNYLCVFLFILHSPLHCISYVLTVDICLVKMYVNLSIRIWKLICPLLPEYTCPFTRRKKSYPTSHMCSAQREALSNFSDEVVCKEALLNRITQQTKLDD